jgi:hypothetical protein
MTKKDYELIARAIKSALEKEEGNTEKQAGVSRLAHILAFELENENPRFQPSKFLKACGFMTFTK